MDFYEHKMTVKGSELKKILKVLSFGMATEHPSYYYKDDIYTITDPEADYPVSDNFPQEMFSPCSLHITGRIAGEVRIDISRLSSRRIEISNWKELTEKTDWLEIYRYLKKLYPSPIIDIMGTCPVNLELPVV